MKHQTVGQGEVTVREAVIDLLRGFDMTTVFGNPGSTELPFLTEWPADFRYILGLQESAVVAMADGYARRTGRAAFCNLHSAVGVGHAAGSLFTAFRNQTPLVVTAGQQARSLLAGQPFLGATDAAAFPKPYVKWSVEPARAEDVPAAIAHAYYIAMQKPYGPTFVSVPSDDWARPTRRVAPRTIGFDTAPDPAFLAELATALDAAERPVFVVGPEVDSDGAGEAMVALAERVGGPVFVSPFSSRVSFPEDHRLFAGFLPAAPEPIGATLAPYDCVVVIGAPVFTFHVPGECGLFSSGTPLYQLSADGEAIANAPVGTGILGSLRLALPDLTARLRRPARAGGHAAPERPVPPATEPILAEYLLHVLARMAPADAVLVEEAPSHRPALQKHWPIRRYGGFYTMASGGLGYSLPAAVGTALAAPAERVICLIGDGSMMYSLQALWTAVQHRLPVTVVIVNNSGYGAMRSFSRVLKVKSPPGIDLPGLDFVALAAGMGCPGEKVERAAAIAPALERAFALPGPSLIEVMVDPAIPKLYDDGH